MLHFSQLGHVENLYELCERELGAKSRSHRKNSAPRSNICEMIVHDEFIVFQSKIDPKIEMVCYDNNGSGYSLEEQKCTIHER